MTTSRLRIYARQSTADSAFSEDSLAAAGYACKNCIEEEEAAEEARVRSMLPVDPPHPELSGLTPPSPGEGGKRGEGGEGRGERCVVELSHVVELSVSFHVSPPEVLIHVQAGGKKEEEVVC